MWDGVRYASDAHGPSLMKIVLLVLLFAYVIAFFWVIWKSAIGWRWYHLLLASLAFLLTIPLLPMTAGVLKSRAAWTKLQADLQEQLARGEQEQERLKHGDPNNVSGGPGLLALQADLRSLSSEVGRVYRDLQVRDRGPNGIVLAPAPAAPEGIPEGMPGEDEQAAAATLPPIAEGAVLHGFAEQPWQGESQESESQEAAFTVPTFYMGEYRVTQSTPEAVTIVPNGQLEPKQQQAINQVNRWSLYELLPLDSHEAFIAEGSQSDEDAIFGRVDEALVNRLLGDPVILEETRDAYLRDGTRAQPDDPPATRWVKIQFKKSVTVPVDSQEQRSAADGGFFDSLGQAVDSRLQREDGDEVQFAEGDQLIVKQEATSVLIELGAEFDELAYYFVRPLNSYRLVLRRLRQQIDYLNGQADELQRQKEVIERAVALTTEMQTKGQQRKLNLEKDAAQVDRELTALRAYSEQLEQQLRATKQEMAAMYRENLAREQELETLQRELAEEIDVREASTGS